MFLSVVVAGAWNANRRIRTDPEGSECSRGQTFVRLQTPAGVWTGTIDRLLDSHLQCLGSQLRVANKEVAMVGGQMEACVKCDTMLFYEDEKVLIRDTGEIKYISTREQNHLIEIYCEGCARKTFDEVVKGAN